MCGKELHASPASQVCGTATPAGGTAITLPGGVSRYTSPPVEAAPRPPLFRLEVPTHNVTRACACPSLPLSLRLCVPQDEALLQLKSGGANSRKLLLRAEVRVGASCPGGGGCSGMVVWRTVGWQTQCSTVIARNSRATPPPLDPPLHPSIPPDHPSLPLLLSVRPPAGPRSPRVQRTSPFITLPEVQVTDSSEALLTGRKPPFRLLVQVGLGGVMCGCDGGLSGIWVTLLMGRTPAGTGGWVGGRVGPRWVAGSSHPPRVMWACAGPGGGGGGTAYVSLLVGRRQGRVWGVGR